MIFLEKTILKELWKPINFGEDYRRINPTIIYNKKSFGIILFTFLSLNIFLCSFTFCFILLGLNTK